MERGARLDRGYARGDGEGHRLRGLSRRRGGLKFMSAMKKLMVVLFAVVLLAVGGTSPASGQVLSPCVGGCDAEYIPFGLSYNPYEMWETYGYPKFILYQNDPPRGCWWYDG